MGSVPPGTVLSIFDAPLLISLIIVISELIRSLFELFCSPFFRVSFFSLKFVVFFTPFRFLVVFTLFLAALEAGRHLFSIFIQKLIQRLWCSSA